MYVLVRVTFCFVHPCNYCNTYNVECENHLLSCNNGICFLRICSAITSMRLLFLHLQSVPSLENDSVLDVQQPPTLLNQDIMPIGSQIEVSTTHLLCVMLMGRKHRYKLSNLNNQLCQLQISTALQYLLINGRKPNQEYLKD